MPEKTIFEKILDKELPSTTVYENEWVYAFNDIAPRAPVHVLIIPKTKAAGISKISELTDQQILELFKSVPVVASILGLTNGYRVVINEGKDGQQAVEYLHLHLLGGIAMQWHPA